jgi:hypothetical protein
VARLEHLEVARHALDVAAVQGGEHLVAHLGRVLGPFRLERRERGAHVVARGCVGRRGAQAPGRALDPLLDRARERAALLGRRARARAHRRVQQALVALQLAQDVGPVEEALGLRARRLLRRRPLTLRRDPRARDAERHRADRHAALARRPGAAGARSPGRLTTLARSRRSVGSGRLTRSGKLTRSGRLSRSARAPSTSSIGSPPSSRDDPPGEADVKAGALMSCRARASCLAGARARSVPDVRPARTRFVAGALGRPDVERRRTPARRPRRRALRAHARLAGRGARRRPGATFLLASWAHGARGYAA